MINMRQCDCEKLNFAECETISLIKLWTLIIVKPLDNGLTK